MADCILSGGDVERMGVALIANEGAEEPELLMSVLDGMGDRPGARNSSQWAFFVEAGGECLQQCLCKHEQTPPNTIRRFVTLQFGKMSHARVHTQASNRAQKKKKKRERPCESDESRKVVFKSTLDNPLIVKWRVIWRFY
jgi:hypothetical protein